MAVQTSSTSRGDRKHHRRASPAAALTAILLASAVGAMTLALIPDSGASRIAKRSQLGPRSLAPTFVRLELGAFPRRARTACRDNRTVVRVSPPRGIAQAVASARPGTTVLAAPGVYVESPGEPTALEWSTPNVCLRATRGRAVLRAAPGQTYGISIGGSDTVIEGFTLRGFGSSIGMNAGEGRTQRRVTIERVRVERPSGDFRDGIVAYGDNRGVEGTPPTVDGLLLYDVSVRGADLGVSCNAGPCEHWWVERTRIAARGRTDDTGADAFAIEDGRQIAFVDSSVRGASGDGIDTKASDVVVYGARVIGMRRNGIKLWRGGDVINTVVDGTGADAALVGDQPGRYRYLHVLVTHHGRAGDTGYVGSWGYDDTRPGLRLEIVNSIFAQNATGGLFASSSAGLSVRNTIFGDRDSKLFDLYGDRVYMTSQLAAFEAAGYGQDNIVAEPRLGGARRHWMPLAGSPAIDAARRVRGLRRDLLGRPRATGRGPDIGPVERRGG